MDKEDIHKTAIAAELYFLIAKFLEAGPCSETSKVLKEELVKYEILPKRLDWEGSEHNQSFDEVKQKFTHIGANHLVSICQRIGPILDKEIKPTVSGLNSLLGAGRQSLLRTVHDVCRKWFPVQDYSVRLNSRPLCEPVGFKCHNLVKVLQGRENSGPLSRRQVTIPAFYSRLQQLCCTLGHLSAVYCLLFDNTGNYVITGADDLLVKVWSVKDGRLLATLRGASTEITDIAVNTENTLLAAGSVDKILRVWCLQTGYPVAVLTGHSGMITGVNFCPTIVNGVHYLVSTSTDGSVAFWSYSTSASKETTFLPKPILYNEKMRPGNAQMICSGFSPGGMFLAAGSGDHHVRIYKMDEPEGPTRVLEIEAHSDRVDSIQWAHSHLRFISGSKDGTANIWYYSRQQWKNIQLMMNKKLSGESEDDAKLIKFLRVTMVSWDVSDKWVITAVADHTLKIWNSFTGDLIQVLKGHSDEVYCVESHPHDSRLLLSAGHDGQLFLWDILTGEKISHFQNAIEGQGFGAIFDAKWSPNGTMMAATDSHGQILMYALSVSDSERQVPRELFFHTDYRPLIRDAQHNVLDEQTNIAPHLMAPPFLVDIEGNPYPPWLQRLVPGRELCTADQLIPNIIFNASGQQEVIEGLHEPQQNLDRIIQVLDARIQNLEQGARSRISPTPRVHQGPRRSGDIEGVRQSSGNWQQKGFHWSQRQLCEPLDPASLKQKSERIRFYAGLELDQYRRESKRPPEVVTPVQPVLVKKRVKRNHNYRTRAAHEEQLSSQFEDPSNLNLGGSDSGNDSAQIISSAYESEDNDSGSSSDSSSSSVYSDWIADNQINLEPPKRSRQRRPPPKKKKAETMPPIVKNQLPQEVPEIFRPPEWLSEVIPKKSPYYPQMGDELVFFKQGYLLYLEAVKVKNVYPVNDRMANPWGKLQMKEPELVKVVGIRYEIKPPRLCCLRFAIMKQNGRLTNDMFTIKYHDMPDVIDFLVLRQTYDTALARQWKVGDRFRSMIDDAWWWGTIESRRTDQNRLNSPFLCFRVLWDNNERENLSPWDLEPCDPDCEPDERGGSAPVLPEEIEAILYHPRPTEWPHGDREGACQRILHGLNQVMTMSIAEPFLVPVDISQYPTYAYIVEYPLDLSTIKARFENQFYRRVTAAQFDVRYLATNAEKFNEPHSTIVKNARIITDICLRIIKELVEVDVPSLYRQLQESYHSSDSEDEKVTLTSTRLRPSTSASRHSVRRRNGLRQPFEWRKECKILLEKLWASKDSEPFREPVDRLVHPDYDKIINTPMDLGTVRDELSVGNYENPNEFCKDIRRIFENAKSYTPDKHTKIYSMTVRLSALAEEHLKRITNCWKNQQHTRSRTRLNGAVNSQARSSRRIINSRKRSTTSPQPGTSRDVPNPLDCEPTSSGIRVLRPKRVVKQDSDDSNTSGSSDSSESGSDSDSESESSASDSEEKSSSNQPKNKIIPQKGRKRLKSSSPEEVHQNHEADSSRVRTRGVRQNYAVMMKSEESDVSDEVITVNKRQPPKKHSPLKSSNSKAATSLRAVRRVRNCSSENSMNSISNSGTSESTSQLTFQGSLESNSRTRTPQKRKRRKILISDSDDSEPSSRRPQRGKRKNYDEHSDASSTAERNGHSDSDENQPAISMSSRGRVRKLTAKARACFRDR
ncbi:unnamed protein product [Bemisia tabaci]|uniref:Bromo domain-containing protein n=1 Tax=Bemisia tabaci TaxID=7038 RepID=A0A9P0AE98_BEMTA|nr:unnamed protein product [Bemisia tabaci]